MQKNSILSEQKKFFNDGATKDLEFRRSMLERLRDCFKAAEKDILLALHSDLGKSEFEAYSTELAVVYQELSLNLKNLKRWASCKKVSTNFINFPGKSRIMPEPYGSVLIMGAWNYPFQLIACPLIPCVAAGNTALIKPSEMAPATSSVISEIINSAFAPHFLHVVQGGADLASKLIKMPFDKIFFTGSTRIGKIVARCAAENLVPATLELGGKSPVLITQDADLETAARRIAWGKMLNAGQTCIAPDHVLIHHTVTHEFLKLIAREFDKYNASASGTDSPFSRIINTDHLNRLTRLIDRNKVYQGNISDPQKLYLSPTIIYPASYQDRCMQEEIFGPILPVIPFNSLKKTLHQISSLPRPLAFYLFTKCSKTRDEVLSKISFGTGAVNDVVMQAANQDLPFGGVGAYGMGRYHGQSGFNEFSNFKSVLLKPTRPDFLLRYPPWSKWKLKLDRLFLR